MKFNAYAYEPPEVPYCIIAKVTWGVVQVCKVPEARAEDYVTKHQWEVLIRDSEFPVALYPPFNNPQVAHGDGDEGGD